jgi:hypothetical protein
MFHVTTIYRIIFTEEEICSNFWNFFSSQNDLCDEALGRITWEAVYSSYTQKQESRDDKSSVSSESIHPRDTIVLRPFTLGHIWRKLKMTHICSYSNLFVLFTILSHSGNWQTDLW